MGNAYGYGNYGGAYPASGDRTRTVFGQTMGYVAVTAGLFTLGAYLGRNLSNGVGLLCFVAAFGCLIGMRFAARGTGAAAVPLLCAFGILLGLAMAPTLVYYASAEPRALWDAGGCTALFIAGFGSFGYATRRDLAMVGRICFFALIGLILFGIVLIFVSMPGADILYSVLGLVIFAGLTMFDFQRLHRSKNMNAAPMIAASIFLDILNVFLFFLRIFSRGN